MKFKEGDLVRLKDIDHIDGCLPKNLDLKGNVARVAFIIEKPDENYILTVDGGFISVKGEYLEPVFGETHNDDTVFEMCLHCNHEVAIVWNVEDQGLQIYCPYCGEKMMLCSECPVRDGEEACDWQEGKGCKHGRPTMKEAEDIIRDGQHEVADHFGLDPQMMQTIEECGELIVAIRKYERYGTYSTRDNLIEEIADVKNMITQLEYLLNCKDKVNEWVAHKVARTLETIAKSEAGEG